MPAFDPLENGKIIHATPPKDITGAGFDGDLVSMADCELLTIVLVSGAWAGGTAAVTVTQETSASGSSNTAVAFSKQWVSTYASADQPTETAVTSNTFNISAANKMHVIKIRPEMLTDGYAYVRVRVASPGSNADLAACIYLQTGLKYAGDPANIPTAIT